MALRDDTVTIDLRRSFDLPVTGLLLLKAAFITDPVLYLTPLVLARRNTKDLIAAIPQSHLALAAFMRTVAMRIYRLKEPNAVFEPEGLIRQRTHRAYVDDIPDKVVVQRCLDIGSDLGMVAAVEYSVNALVC